uniref:Rho GTPase activating protein 45 n=1 Tax=Sarcophilus harrisii TaxID=9305 RepID=A0A7N4NUI6_SARHA
MFSRKKRELMKTPSISKKSRAGSPSPQAPSELARKDVTELSSHAAGLDLSPGGTKLGSGTMGTLKRPTSLSRHASAAGFPLSAPGTWTLGRGHRSPMTNNPVDGSDGPFVDVEDISQLLAHVARFAEALEKLKDTVLRDEQLDARRPLAHECLGEVLRVLRQVIGKYPLLNTLETLTAAGTLISKVKGFHYESNNEADKRELEKALETIAVSFSSTVSEFLMGEVDITSLRRTTWELGEAGENSRGTRARLLGAGCLLADDVDVVLQRCEGGVDVALQYAKNIAKYMKDLIYYLEKRTMLEMEFAKGLQKIVNSCKQTITQEPHMPFLSIYSLALEQDMEFSHGMLQVVTTLQNQTLMQPLTLRRLEHEKKRKEIKDQWHRAQRKGKELGEGGTEAEGRDYEKAKFLTVKAEEEQGSGGAAGAGGGPSSAATKALDKKRRLEEEAKNKAEEAMATYRTCIADAKTQKQELEDVKVNSLRQIQEVIKQSDQIIKSATISYYQTMHMQTAPLPPHRAEYASRRQLRRVTRTAFDFEPYVSHNTWSPLVRARKSSFTTNESSGSTEGSTVAGSEGGAVPKERRGGRGHQVHKSWPISMTDSDSSLDPSANGAGDFQKMERTSSSGTMSSSEELADKEGHASAFEQTDLNGIAPEIPVPTGPFRNVGLSKAAQTHRLRKLRTPSKCRECNSYVYFQGAECEECCLACHKKCLETLAIQCGHKKLQGKLQLFGQDFQKAAQGTSDGVPFIIKKCLAEIERRALRTKGIYRVNGVKTRVEKLCQAFENGKELVELSQASPHDISNVLKLYLRQLPEPILSFRLYHELMGLAKESLQAEAEAKASRGRTESDRDKEQDTEAMISRLRDLLKELPPENKATLKYLIRHLRRIVEVEQDNKMTPGNLGIVFGPTLLRPRPTEATVSLSSLVDYPHQARIVETLISHYNVIFEIPAGEVQEESPDSEVGVCISSVSLESINRSNDSDSELEDSSDLQVSDGASALRRLSLLMKQESETSTEEGSQSHSGSVEQLDPVRGEQSDGDDDQEPGREGLVLQLSSYNTNQSNNTLPLPTVRLRGGKLTMGTHGERRPEFV